MRCRRRACCGRILWGRRPAALFICCPIAAVAAARVRFGAWLLARLSIIATMVSGVRRASRMGEEIMNHRRILRAFASVSLMSIAAVASPAAAQQIQRIVAFGDSYADTGNAFALGYANPQALAVYSTGRFSGGTNYIDTLSDILQVPVEDFAIGGAFGGTNNGTLCF